MIIPKQIGALPSFGNQRNETSRESIDYAPTSSVLPIPTYEWTAGTSTVTDVFEVSDNEYWEILRVIVVPPGGSGSTVRLYIIPPGDSPSFALHGVFEQALSAREAVRVEQLDGHIIGPGFRLGAFSATDVDFLVHSSVRRHFRGSRRD